MNRSPVRLRALFCISVTQNFFDLPPAGIGLVWQAFGALLCGLRAIPDVTILGTLDDDQTMVGASTGWPYTVYVMADVPDRDAVVAGCNLLRTISVGQDRLWKFCRVEARIGRELVIPD